MRRALTMLLLSLAAALPACGDDPPEVGAGPGTTSAPPGDDGDFPVTVLAANGEVRLDERPERVVSLTPTGTEMLFAVGAGEAVVAGDEYSNFPPEAPTTELSGTASNLEAIAGYSPDLVVASNDTGDLLAGLDRVGIPAVLMPAAVTLDDTYAQIEQLGALTGHVGDAAEVVAGMQADIEELAAQVPERVQPLTYYHELDSSLYSATSRTFIGAIYALAGLENIADRADPDGSLGGYPQLSAELLVSADPDLVFLADTKCCQQDAETYAARPGLASLGAVREERIVELDDDIASRWGPRIVDFLRTVVEATALVPSR